MRLHNSFSVSSLLLVGWIALASTGWGYIWCEDNVGTGHRIAENVKPKFNIELDESPENMLPPSTYQVKLISSKGGVGYVEFTVNGDRRVSNITQTGIDWLSSFSDSTEYWVSDGCLYETSAKVVGTASGGASYSWSKAPICGLCSCNDVINGYGVYYQPFETLSLKVRGCSSGGATGGAPSGGAGVGGSGAGFGIPARAGEVKLGLESIHFQLGLGPGTNYLNTGELLLVSEVINTNLSRAARLMLKATADIKRTSDTNGLRQVLSAQFLADIITSNAYRYDIRLYKAGDAGTTNGLGLYEPQASNVVKTITVQNPDEVANFNRLWITETEGTSTNLYQYTLLTNSMMYSNTWVLEYPSNLRKEVVIVELTTNRLQQIVTRSTYKPGSPDTLIYQERTYYQNDGFGARPVQQVIGTNGVSLTNVWAYYTSTNASEVYRYGLLKEKTDWSGYWERYEYDGDDRETNRLSGFLNATNGSPTNLCRTISKSYVQNYYGTTGMVTQVEKVLGLEVARTYTLLYTSSNCVKTVQCTVPGATLSDSGNLVTITTRDSYNRPTNIIYPDFTRALYSYVTNADKSVTTTLRRGLTNGTGNVILEGTKTITVTGPYGEMVSNIVLNITGGADAIILERDSYSYNPNDYDRDSPVVTHLDGTVTSGTSGCCGSPNSGNTVAKDGTTTYYVEDALKRRVSATVNNITSSNIFDAYGNTLITMRIGTDASVITNRIAVYDTAARLIAETNALNSPTLYTNWIDGTGQLVKQTTHADGGRRIETYYRDGQLQSVTGSAVFPVRYEYGVESESGVQRLYTKETKLDAAGSDTSEWTKTYTDMLGRTYKTVYAAASGAPFAISYWNTKGQLTNQVDPDGVSTLFTYNPRGEIAATIVDSNRNYTIDWAGTDRITWATNDVVNNGTVNVRRTRTYVWSTSANSSNLISTVESSADGLRSWNTIWNNGTAITSQSRTVYDAANGYRYVTNIAPDNSYSVTVTRYGTNVSETGFDSLNTQLSAVSYAYDTHGRPCRLTDARTGTMTNYFNNADQVSGTATPAPSAGEFSQVTTNYFDSMGRVCKTTLPDSTSVTNRYDVTGLLTNTFGSRTYPVAYSYDAQGRMKAMKTWQNFAANSGTAITTWNYDIYRGWLTNKTYDGGAAGPTYTYTMAGRLATRLWARGTNTTYSYNYAGDLMRVDYSDSTTDLGYGYDRRGRQIYVTNDTALACSYAYSDANMLLSESYASGPLAGLIVTNGYDSLLRRTAVGFSNYSGTLTTYGYDNVSRLAWVTNGGNTVNYGYLANSPLVENLSFRQGGTTRMTTVKTYDNLNRLLSITNQPNADSAVGYRYAYNNANQRTSVTNADTARWVYQYDSLGQVISGKKYWSDGTPVAGQQFEYTFDDIGNRKSTASGGDQSGVNLRSASYGANLLNQYTNRTVPAYVDVQGTATNTATVTVNYQPTYRHGDYFRAELTADNSSAPLWFGVTNVAVLNNGTNADIVASTTGLVFVAQSSEVFSHNLDGNLANDGRWSYTWDVENRATSFTRNNSAPSAAKAKVECQYDYCRRRTQKIDSTWNGSTYVAQSTNKFVYDGWNLIAVLDATNGLVQSFTWGLDASGSLQGAGGVGGIISMTVHQGTNSGTYFYCFDGNHNVAMLINSANGTIGAEYECDAFGNILKATGPLAFVNPFVFSTKFCDWETGFYYYGYRYYDPSTGRWLSGDPVAELGSALLTAGDYSANSSLHSYSFVENDPTDKLDFLGMFSEALVKQMGFDFWRTHMIKSSHWREVMDAWYYENKFPDVVWFRGMTDPRNQDIASNIGFTKLLECWMAQKNGKNAPTGRSWKVESNGFYWHYDFNRNNSAGGFAAYRDETEFLGSYYANVTSSGQKSPNGKCVVDVDIFNISGWTSGTRLPSPVKNTASKLGITLGTSLYPSHPRRMGPYFPSRGGDLDQHYVFKAMVDCCAKCSLP